MNQWQKKKKELEQKFESELTKRLIEKHGMVNLIKKQAIQNLNKANPILLAKFGALLFKYKEDEIYTTELYEKREKEILGYNIKKIKELQIRQVCEDFLSVGISGIMSTFQISTVAKV